MRYRTAYLCSFAFALLSLAAVRTAHGQVAETPQIPADFSQFDFAGHSEEAQLLSNYLWYHFYQRLGNSLSLFNKEYLLFSDTWLNGAIARDTSQTIQRIHRDALLAIEMDAEGYVDTHQHFSHAHDRGWPFPMWTLGGNGITAGWHFQPLDQVPGWVGDSMRHRKDDTFCGENAAAQWTLNDVQSDGIVNNAWHLSTTGPNATLTSPEGLMIDAFNCPYVQIRWSRSGDAPFPSVPYIEWQRIEDTGFAPDRRHYFYPDRTPLSGEGRFHSIMPLHRHPLWAGKIKRLRIALAPGETGVAFDIDSIFTAYDTRHTINNPIFILASWYYFNWTGDLDFLRRNMNRMRTALRYQQTEMGGLEFNRIRNPWPGHDGRPGWTKDAEGHITPQPGHGIGNNYWDIMPFGGDDFYATYQYFAATRVMADLEDAIRSNPGWDIPRGPLTLEPEQLRAHADAVKTTANELFWNPETGRYIAAIDEDGKRYDFGFTFLNLDAIWYGIATEEHARSIMDWISGRRTVEGDTSTGTDIYRWRFGPRATTRRNLEWYGQGWTHPESIPWGGQVQDGGGVLGFTFYDLWARLHVYGPDDAWQRLTEILAWEKEVHAAGGYRAYYADGKQGTTLQGGGTAGGVGIDAEFFESSLLPSIVVYGFAGLSPEPDGLHISPSLPQAVPELTVRNVLYRGTPLDVRVTLDAITLTLQQAPAEPVTVRFDAPMALDSGEPASEFVLNTKEEFRFARD